MSVSVQVLKVNRHGSILVSFLFLFSREAKYTQVEYNFVHIQVNLHDRSASVTFIFRLALLAHHSGFLLPLLEVQTVSWH